MGVTKQAKILNVVRIGVAAAVTGLTVLGCTSSPAPGTTSAGPAAAVTMSPAPAVLASGMTPSPTPAVDRSLPPAGATDPRTAAKALFYNPDAGPTVCRPSRGPAYSAAAGCPVTPRLQQRLQSNPTPGADPICRCQNAVENPSLSIMDQTATNALLLVDFSTLRSGNVLNFMVVASGGRWLVDDTSCGDQSSSIYVNPVRPCST